MTEKYIDRLPFCTTAVEFYDARVTGFGVRIGATSKVYFVKGRANGVQFKRTLGKFGLTSFDEAVAAAIQILRDAEKGILPGQTAPPNDKPAAITLSSVAKEYVKVRKTIKPTTRDLYAALMNRYLSDWLDLPMQLITPAMVVTRHAEVGVKSPAGADSTFRVVRALFNFAMDMHDEEITKNPVKRLSSTRAWYKVPRREKYVKVSELAIFFAALREKPCLVSDYLEALLFTGIRSASEIAKLKIEDLDITGCAINLYDGKTKKYQYIPISKTVLAILQRRTADAREKKSRYLFYSFQEQAARNGVWVPKPNGGHIKDVRGTIKQILAGTVLSAITPHDLRRTFLTYADELEISNVVQKSLVGHAIPTDITDGYKIITMERLRAAVDKIEEYILKHAITGIL